jgi:hypothetical protein
MPRPLTVTGFLNSDAMNFVDCPECHASARTCCVTDRGKRLGTQHKARIGAYLQKFPDRLELYKEGADRLDRALLYNQRQLTKTSRTRSWAAKLRP